MISDALDIFDKFIKVAKELSKLRELATPRYKACARDLYEISQRLLEANENLSRWLNRFSYFDFKSTTARSDFLQAIKEYRTMRNGPEFQQLRFHCHDIEGIYYQNIKSGIRDWFTNKNKRYRVKSIFNKLSKHDAQMVDFVLDKLLGLLDKTLKQLENVVDAPKPNMRKAEKIRLKFKAGLSEVTPRLERFNNEIAKLVMDYAKIAKVPITLKRGTS